MRCNAPARRKTMRHNAPLTLAACLALAGCGVGQSAQTIVAHKIADALPQAIGPAAHYDVQVSGDTLGLARGRARGVSIHGWQVQMTPAVTLDALTLDARDIVFDARSRQVQSIGGATFAASLGQANLNRYLAQTRPDLQVTLGQSELTATLPVSVGPLRTTVAVAGVLAPTSPGASTLDFITDRARLGILPVPAFAVNAALEAVNPVLDLSRVKVPIGVQSADVEAGLLTLRGTAQLDALSRRQ